MGGVLAHAGVEKNGQGVIHFDESEHWTSESYNGIFLQKMLINAQVNQIIHFMAITGTNFFFTAALFSLLVTFALHLLTDFGKSRLNTDFN